MSVGSILQVNGLTTTYRVGGRDVPVLDNLSFHCEAGERVGLAGESGSGKSVVALSLLRLIRPPGRIAAGEVLLDGQDVLRLSPAALRRVRGGQIAIVFQDPGGSLTPVYSIGTQLVETMRAHLPLSRAEAVRRAVELLGQVGIPEPERRMESFPHELSGGMKQRVAIALALSCNPKVLIADDPTSAVDVTIQAQILQLLDELTQDERLTLILISHDFRVISTICERVLILYSGDIVETGPSYEVFGRPRHPYTRALLECAPSIEEYRFPFATLSGSPPNLVHGRVAGCPFHPRCARRVEPCATEMPPLEPTLPSAHAYACWNPEPIDECASARAAGGEAR